MSKSVKDECNSVLYDLTLTSQSPRRFRNQQVKCVSRPDVDPDPRLFSQDSCLPSSTRADSIHRGHHASSVTTLSHTPSGSTFLSNPSDEEQPEGEFSQGVRFAVSSSIIDSSMNDVPMNSAEGENKDGTENVPPTNHEWNKSSNKYQPNCYYSESNHANKIIHVSRSAAVGQGTPRDDHIDGRFELTSGNPSSQVERDAFHPCNDHDMSHASGNPDQVDESMMQRPNDAIVLRESIPDDPHALRGIEHQTSSSSVGVKSLTDDADGKLCPSVDHQMRDQMEWDLNRLSGPLRRWSKPQAHGDAVPLYDEPPINQSHEACDKDLQDVVYRNQVMESDDGNNHQADDALVAPDSQRSVHSLVFPVADQESRSLESYNQQSDDPHQSSFPTLETVLSMMRQAPYTLHEDPTHVSHVQQRMQRHTRTTNRAPQPPPSGAPSSVPIHASSIANRTLLALLGAVPVSSNQASSPSDAGLPALGEVRRNDEIGSRLDYRPSSNTSDDYLSRFPSLQNVLDPTSADGQSRGRGTTVGYPAFDRPAPVRVDRKTILEQLKGELHKSVVSKIDHSSKFSDDVYEYRFVILPRSHPWFMFDFDEQLREPLLDEDEWRLLGIGHTRGWEHYGYSRHESNVLLFRRALGTDPKTGRLDSAPHQGKVYERMRLLETLRREHEQARHFASQLAEGPTSFSRQKRVKRRETRHSQSTGEELCSSNVASTPLISTVSGFGLFQGGSSMDFTTVLQQQQSQLHAGGSSDKITAHIVTARNLAAVIRTGDVCCQPSNPFFDLSSNSDDESDREKRWLESGDACPEAMSQISPNIPNQRFINDVDWIYASLHMPLFPTAN